MEACNALSLSVAINGDQYIRYDLENREKYVISGREKSLEGLHSTADLLKINIYII